MFLRNSILAGCTIAIVPFVGLLNKFYGSWLAKNAVRVQNALADATSCAHESLSCIKTVIMLGSEDQECEKYKSHINRLYDLNIWQLIATGVYYMFVSTFLINTLVQATLLLLGSIFVQQGKLTADVLLAFMLYQGRE
jgi:ATP-binding cassette subfamily B (MDR/TAP) protein 9